jgi:hypothetical protein
MDKRADSEAFGAFVFARLILDALMDRRDERVLVGI